MLIRRRRKLICPQRVSTTGPPGGQEVKMLYMNCNVLGCIEPGQVGLSADSQYSTHHTHFTT